MFKTFQEMCDDESICDYCKTTDYGSSKSYQSPTGYYSCEGSYCNEAYERYLDDNETNENIVKYQECVKLINKEKFE